MHRITAAALFAVTLVPTAHADEPADSLARAPSRHAKLDAIRVHYKSVGEGKTAVVFVHGFAADMSTWHFQVSAFADKARVVLIDLPGYGRSDKPKVEYTMDLFAGAVNAVLADAGADKAVLVGHSMGTGVVRQFWRQYPDKTVALVAVDGLIAPLPTPQGLADLDWPKAKEMILKFSDTTLGKDTPADVREAIKAGVANTPEHVARSTMKGMADPAVWKDDPIKVPVQMIMAATPFWPSDYEKQVRKLAPRLDYLKMEGVGHFLLLEKPNEFNEHLGEFLAKQGALKSR